MMMKLLLLVPALLVVMLAAACSVETREPAVAAVHDSLVVAARPLVVPHDSLIPDGALGASIRRGRAILTAAGDSLPDHVGNRLTCTNCHLDAGTRAFAAPWVGVYARFPQYRGRNARVNLLEDRINDCIQRSLKGRALAFESSAMRDMVAYMAWLSREYPVGSSVAGEGFDRFGPLEPDTAGGATVYVRECARCHGAAGDGMQYVDSVGVSRLAPPLWGPDSYTIGAGMARLRTAAAFVRANMPFDRPRTLTDQEAYDVAAYINAQPRGDFAGKEHDWPRGGAPPDAAYPTMGARQ